MTAGRRYHADMTTGPDRDDAAREAIDAFHAPSPTPPDVEILAAVQHGLESVPTGTPGSWSEVPSQRRRTPPGEMVARRPT